MATTVKDEENNKHNACWVLPRIPSMQNESYVSLLAWLRTLQTEEWSSQGCSLHTLVVEMCISQSHCSFYHIFSEKVKSCDVLFLCQVLWRRRYTSWLSSTSSRTMTLRKKLHMLPKLWNTGWVSRLHHNPTGLTTVSKLQYPKCSFVFIRPRSSTRPVIWIVS